MFTSSFCFLGRIFVIPSQVFPKILTEERRPSKRHWCMLRPAPLVSKLRDHHVSRNLTQTQNSNSLLQPLPSHDHRPPPHPTLGRWPLPEDARESFHMYISNRLCLTNFHFGKDLGAKLWPETLALMRSFKKKETTNLIFAVKYVASL